MKIALLIELFYPHTAGSERRFFEIGRRLSSRGHEVHVFTLRYEASLPKEETVEGIFVHRYAHSGNYISPASSRSLSGVLRYSFMTSARLFARSFDVYYSNEWPMLHSIVVKPLASPIVQEWCEVWTDSRRVRMLQRMLKLVGDYHVAVSEFTRNRMVNLLKIRPEKIFLVPNGVDYPKLCAVSKGKTWGRIIYVGRLVPHKHVEMLVDAFRQVKGKAPEAELHIVGSGPSLSSIKDRASNVDDCFVYGFLPEDELLDLLKSAWLFVLPSDREGSSIATLEAMAAGLPFVTVDYPDNAAKELAQFGCGLTVDSNSDAIASAILQFFGDERMWKEMSRRASRFAERHDWEAVTNLLERFLLRVVGDDK